MSEVNLINLSKKYDNNKKVVNNVNLKIHDKEFVVIVGPSGCGKSTTLRMIAGLEEISEGEIYIDGKCVNNLPPKDRDIAMVFQNYALYPHMTVYENMAFGLKVRKFDKQEIDKRVKEAARILGLEELLNRKPKALSGGQRQRVAVGRAIVRNPKVFLFDEPLSNLDAKMRVQMRAEITKLHKKLEATMIYVTHDQIEAMTMGDRIVVMKDGVVQQVDTPMNLYFNPYNKFVAGFIGSPAMNFISGKIINDGKLKFVSSKNGLSFYIIPEYYDRLQKYSNKEIILGIRPEHIKFEKPQRDYSKISITTELIEPMGSESIVYFTIDDVQFTAKINMVNELHLNETIELYFELNNLHFFDKDSEISII
ncbi:ABC transporter ATP-binding protein [Melioribacter sp. OK-6-Me]|uniref:ABC transporter ATP-binding protein n=1 Tax=unclassified Melioribacter TaxID=2627329 RepID=UPI003EDAF634